MKLSDELTSKVALDNDNNYEAFMNYKICPKSQVGISLHMKTNQTEGFKGYLDYPFNFGLNFKFDN